jgi:hypothetical protein
MNLAGSTRIFLRNPIQATRIFTATRSQTAFRGATAGDPAYRKGESMASMRRLNDGELHQIEGGGGFLGGLAGDFCKGINQALGREGKPFFGRDLVECAAEAVGHATGVPGGGFIVKKHVKDLYDDARAPKAGGPSGLGAQKAPASVNRYAFNPSGNSRGR